MKLITVIITVLFSCSAFSQQEANWKLVRQVSAPENLDCTDEATLNISGNSLEFIWGQNYSVNMPDVNGEAICYRLSSGSILGGVGCHQSTSTENLDSVIFKQYVCQKEGFWWSSCNPMRKEPRTVIEIKDGNFMTISQRTNGPNINFICEYARQ